MRTNLTFPTTSRELSLNTREFCTTRGTTMKNFHMKLSNLLCLNLFSQRERKSLADPMASCCMVIWGLTFSPLLNCYIQIWKLGYDYSEPDLISTWLATTPTLILETLIVHFTLVVLLSRIGMISRGDDCHKKGMDMLAYTLVEFNCWETLAKTFIIPDTQNQFIQENIFNNAPLRRIVIAIKTTSLFTGFYTENPFWCQQFDLRKIRLLRGGQPIVYVDAADNCRLYVTTTDAMNFQDDILSIPIDNVKDHQVLVFDLTSMQDATENCHYPELVGEPLRLKLNFTFPLEHVTELIVLGERMSSVAVDKFGVVGKNIYNG